MKQISLNLYRKQLEELKRLQGNRNAMDYIIASPEPDGRVRAAIHREGPNGGKQSVEYYDSLYDLLDQPGMSKHTQLLWDDIGFGPDIYLPNELIFCFCPTEEIREFVELADSGDEVSWMEKYVDLIRNLQEHKFPLPDNLAENPAIKDFAANHDQFTPAELVERYKDRKWFIGTQF